MIMEPRYVTAPLYFLFLQLRKQSEKKTTIVEILAFKEQKRLVTTFRKLMR